MPESLRKLVVKDEDESENLFGDLIPVSTPVESVADSFTEFIPADTPVEDTKDLFTDLVPKKNPLNLIPYSALSALQGVTSIFTAPLKGTKFDSGKLISDSVEYWREKSPDILDVPNFSVFSDGKFQLKKEPDTPLTDIIGGTAETSGFVAGPLGAASKAAGLATGTIKAARPFYKSIAKGMVTGALVGEGEKEQTLENMALFGVFEGLVAAGGKFNAARKIAKDQKWRMANIKERGLIIQTIDDLIQKNPNMTEGEILKRWNSDSLRAEALKKRSVGEGGEEIKPVKAAKPEPKEPVEISGEIEFDPAFPIKPITGVVKGEGFTVKPVIRLKKSYPQGADYVAGKEQDPDIDYKPVGKNTKKDGTPIPYKMMSFTEKKIAQLAKKNKIPTSEFSIVPVKDGFLIQRKGVKSEKNEIERLRNGRSNEELKKVIFQARRKGITETVIAKTPEAKVMLYDGTYPKKRKSGVKKVVEPAELSEKSAEVTDLGEARINKALGDKGTYKKSVVKALEPDAVFDTITRIPEKLNDKNRFAHTIAKNNQLEYMGVNKKDIHFFIDRKNNVGYKTSTLGIKDPVAFVRAGNKAKDYPRRPLDKEEIALKRQEQIKLVEKPSKQAKPEKSIIDREDLPELKSTEDAIKFGKTLTKERIPEIEKLRDEAATRSKVALKADNFDLASIEATQSQFWNAALQFYRGELNVPEGKVVDESKLGDWDYIRPKEGSGDPWKAVYKNGDEVFGKGLKEVHNAAKEYEKKMGIKPKGGITPKKRKPLAYDPAEIYSKDSVSIRKPNSAFAGKFKNIDTLHFWGTVTELTDLLGTERNNIDAMYKAVTDLGYNELQFVDISDGVIYPRAGAIFVGRYKQEGSSGGTGSPTPAPKTKIVADIEPKSEPKPIPAPEPKPESVVIRPLGYIPAKFYTSIDRTIYFPEVGGENPYTLHYEGSVEDLEASLDVDSLWEVKEEAKILGYDKIQFVEISEGLAVGDPIDLSETVIPSLEKAKPKEVAKAPVKKGIQTGERTIAAGVDVSSTKARLLKDSLGYNPTRTVVAELLQNSFDATRGVTDKPITVKVRPGVLTVIDHGFGMSPDIMEDDFVNLFKQGSKGEEDMGGFGLAKLPIMGWPDTFKIYSVWEDPKSGKRYFSKVYGTQEEYMINNTLHFESRIAPKGVETGTTVVLKKDDISSYDVSIITQEMGENLRGGQVIDLVSVGDRIDRQDATTNTIKSPAWKDVPSKYAVQSFSLDGSDVEIKFVDTPPYGWQGPYTVKTRVYNKGLLLPDIPQYTSLGKVQLSRKPNFTVEVNFVKTPTASDTVNYPFLVNRTRLTKSIEDKIMDKISKVMRDLEANISAESQQDLVRIFNNAKVMGGTKIIVPFKEDSVSDKVNAELDKYPSLFTDLGKIYSSFSTMLNKHTNIPAHTYAITTYNKVHGFRPKSGILPEDYIVSNPFSYLSATYGGDQVTDLLTPADTQSAATGLIDTLTHEAAHFNQSGHYASYVGEFHRIQRMLSHKRIAVLEDKADEFFKKHGKDIEGITRDLDRIQKKGTVSTVFSEYTPDEQRVERSSLDEERQTNERGLGKAGSGRKGVKRTEKSGVVLTSGLDPVAAAASIKKSAIEIWEGSKPLRKNLGLVNKAFQELLLDPEKIMNRDQVTKQAYKVLANAEEAKNAFIYRNYEAFQEATKGIEPGSIADSRVGKALDGQSTPDKLTKNEKKAYDFFKENYEAMIQEYARRAAGSDEAYKRILHAVSNKKLKQVNVKDLSPARRAAYDALVAEARKIRRGGSVKGLAAGEQRKHESLKQQARDILNEEYIKSLPPNEAEAYTILSRKINDYLPHLFDRKELLEMFKVELDLTKAKLKKSTNKTAITGFKNRINEIEAAISNMEGGRLVTYDQLPSSVFFRFFNPRKGKTGYSFSAMKAYEAYLFGLARKMFDEPAVKLIKENLYDKMPQDMKPFTKALVEHYMGRDKTAFDWLAGAITSFQWMRTLGLNPRSALVNFTQRLNTVAYVGEKYSAIAEKMMFTDRKKANELFDASGVAREVPNVLTEGVMPEGMEKIRSIVGIFFNTVELGNRKHAYLAGYLKAKSRGATDDQAMAAGIKTVHKTQFRYGKLGMPKIFWNPAARVAFQFSSYTIKQAQFIYDLGEFDKLFGSRKTKKGIGFDGEIIGMTKTGGKGKKGIWVEDEYVTEEHRAAGLIRLMKWIAYTSGGSYLLKELLDTDMSNAMGLGITWGEALNVIVALAKGDTKAAWRHAKLTVNPGSGILPQGFGPTVSGLKEVAEASVKDKGLEQLGKELTPVMVSRLLQAYDAVSTKKEKDDLYTVRGTTGNAIYKLSKRQLAQRTFGPRTAKESKISREYDIEQGFKLERTEGLRDVIEALVSGDKKAIEKAVKANKEAVAIALKTKGLLERMVAAEKLSKELTKKERQKPGANELFRALREGKSQ